MPKGIPKKKTEPYRIVLQANGQKYEASGENFLDALAQIKPEAYKTKGVFHIYAGKSEANVLMAPVQMKRLAISHVHRIIFQKRVISLLH